MGFPDTEGSPKNRPTCLVRIRLLSCPAIHKIAGRYASESPVRPTLVVVDSPRRQRDFGIGQIGKLVCVQAFVPKATDVDDFAALLPDRAPRFKHGS